MFEFSKSVIAVLLLSTLAACGSSSESVDPHFEAAQGWILVRHGTVPELEQAIREYDALRSNERPGSFRVELHPQRRGYIAVVLPDGFPAYDLANLTGWLNAPPGQTGVSDAVAWITSPGDDVKYYLEPERANPWGDTLVGASSSGTPVRVYLPETGVSEVSERRSYREEPELVPSEDPVIMKVTLDTDTDFGNPDFVIDSPIDHDWRP